mgnify:CR=1 FL=1
MTTGVWEPKKPADFSRENLVNLAVAVDGETVALSVAAATANSVLMQQEAEAWSVAEAFDDELLVSLVRFFTLAEMQVPGWTAGKRSPVIALVKILKTRGVFDSELRRWIKTHTDNRYLPNGAVL